VIAACVASNEPRAAGQETCMIGGTLIAESLRVGTNLDYLALTVRKISRYQAQGTTVSQPGIWTTLDFEADETAASELAEALAGVLDQPGWYADFRFPRGQLRGVPRPGLPLPARR
jgi:hypothetical protein